MTLDNLRHAFPEKPEAERRRIARGAYRNMATAALEALVPVERDPKALNARVNLEDAAPLFERLERGEAVLVATAHFGSWELLGQVMALRGFAISAVVKPLEGSLNAVIVENRERAGVHLIASRGSLGGALKALRQGHAVAMLVDQVIGKKHALFVPFFGRPAATTPALSLAALRSNAPVYVAMGVREGDGLRLVVEGPFPLPPESEGTTDERLLRHTATVTAALERTIRAHPEQWLWLHRRWKVQPD